MKREDFNKLKAGDAVVFHDGTVGQIIETDGKLFVGFAGIEGGYALDCYAPCEVQLHDHEKECREVGAMLVTTYHVITRCGLAGAIARLMHALEYNDIRALKSILSRIIGK
jgi:preprotein translocase subunit YajC